MTDGPARPMTGIKGAGFPGTAQVNKPFQLILNSILIGWYIQYIAILLSLNP